MPLVTSVDYCELRLSQDSIYYLAFLNSLCRDHDESYTYLGVSSDSVSKSLWNVWHSLLNMYSYLSKWPYIFCGENREMLFCILVLQSPFIWRPKISLVNELWVWNWPRSGNWARDYDFEFGCLPSVLIIHLWFLSLVQIKTYSCFILSIKSLRVFKIVPMSQSCCLR